MVELLHHDSKLEGLIPAGVGIGRYKITKKFCLGVSIAGSVVVEQFHH